MKIGVDIATVPQHATKYPKATAKGSHQKPHYATRKHRFATGHMDYHYKPEMVFASHGGDPYSGLDSGCNGLQTRERVASVLSHPVCGTLEAAIPTGPICGAFPRRWLLVGSLDTCKGQVSPLHTEAPGEALPSRHPNHGAQAVETS